jgi:hypothetical protein
MVQSVADECEATVKILGKDLAYMARDQTISKTQPQNSANWRWHVGLTPDTVYHDDQGAWQPLRRIAIEPCPVIRDQQQNGR